MSGVNVPQHFHTEFARNIDLLLQQKDSRLSGAVSQGNHSGDKASPVDQVGKVEMQDVTTRFAPMGRVDSPLQRRWVLPTSSDLPQLIDTFDALKLLTDPKSKYVENAVAASNRRKDRHIISAFFADALTGVNAGSTESFGTVLTTAGTPGQNVSVNTGGAASSLNVAKIKEGVRRLMEADVDVDQETIYCGYTSKEHDSLLNEIQVISSEFGGAPVLSTKKKLQSWWLVNFIHTELYQTGTDDAAGTSRMIPMWVPNGMHYGNWQSVVTDISQRKDLQGLPWQAYLMMTGGATRLEKERVIRIWCR
jgi:hypothetical protein